MSEREDQEPIGADLFPTGGHQHPSEALVEGERLLGRYVLERRLGAGGMGEVWQAWDQHKNRHCALKRILPSLLENAQTKKRFQREMRLLQSLNNPYIIQLYEIHLDANLFTMELLTGQTLQAYLKQHKRCTLDQSLFILWSLSEGLSQVHEARLVHRDIKPANVFLCETPGKESFSVKLLDFGIAHALDQQRLTQKGHGLLGTPYYLAPEALRGQEEISPKADLYSLGVLLYELLTGELPLAGAPSLMEALEELESAGALAPDECPDECKSGFDALVKERLQPLYRRMLRRKPEDRCTLVQLREQLRELRSTYQALQKDGGRLREQWLAAQICMMTPIQITEALEAARRAYPAQSTTWDQLERRSQQHQEVGTSPGTASFAASSWGRWKLTPGLQSVRPKPAQKLPVLLEFEAFEDAPKQRPPLTLCFCLDNSSSMYGEPLELVMRSVELATSQLQPKDRVGLVSFSTYARRWVPVQPCTEKTLAAIKHAIKQIEADGWTAMYDGLKASILALPEPRPDEVTRILLLSDGCPNQGPSNARELSQFVRENRTKASFSAFGFGVDHDEDILQAIAKAGGGSYTYIDSAETAPTAFALELGGLMSTVASRVRLTIQPRQHCTIQGLRGDNETRHIGRDLEVELGNFIAGQRFFLLLDLLLDASHADERPQSWAEFVLKYLPPGTKEMRQERQTLALAAAPNASQIWAPTVAEKLLLYDAAAAWKTARTHADAHRYEDAISELEQVMEQLRRHPQWADPGSEIRDWYEQFVDELEIYKRRPSETEYRAYRKVALSEMQVSSEVTKIQSSSNLGSTLCQKDMIHLFRMIGNLGETSAYLEVWCNNTMSKRVMLTQQVTIGRVPSNDIVLAFPNVSRRHARLTPTSKGYQLLDLHTSQGTYLNGEPIHGPTLLQDGDEIGIGDAILRFYQG